MTAIVGKGTRAVVATAAMCGEEVPKVSVSEAFDVYCNEIVADEIAKAKLRKEGKGQAPGGQVVHRGVEDKTTVDIARDDARAFHRHWLDKVAPKGGGPAQIRVYG